MDELSEVRHQKRIEAEIGEGPFKLAQGKTFEELSNQLIDALGAIAIKQKVWPSDVLAALGDIDEKWPTGAVDEKRSTLVRQIIRERKRNGSAS